MNIAKYLILFAISLFCWNICFSQSISYEDFFNNSASFYNQNKEKAKTTYNSFREKANQDYIEFLKKAWGDYEKFSPLPKPREENPVPPRPYERIDERPIVIEPIPVLPVAPSPQPQPISPIKDNPVQENEYQFAVSFYGLNENIRLPRNLNLSLSRPTNNSIADAWTYLSKTGLDNAMADVLRIRRERCLSDWAYLQFLVETSGQYCDDLNSALMLAAYLYAQSGYQMRLGIDGQNLVLLFASEHHIFNWPYFVVDGLTVYPIGNLEGRHIRITDAAFEGERPLSLYINNAQDLGEQMSAIRPIVSAKYNQMSANASVPAHLIEFYNTYPTSAVDGNIMTRWAMYANTPLAEQTKTVLYPALKKSIENCSKLEAANKLLNWVQTGFVYEYDDKVWGHDRAFFAEETLYYPYADCEDRSILFSRLVRDLLGLDVALIYYPGHLATAVKFDTDVRGDAMLINGEKYVICDPTYIGAPVGAQMPDLKYDKAEAIILN